MCLRRDFEEIFTKEGNEVSLNKKKRVFVEGNEVKNNFLKKFE